MSRLLFFAALLTLTTFSVVSAQVLVNISSPGLIPEGLEYYDGHFFASSLSIGTVMKVTLDGVVTQFVVDNRLVSTLGLQVDSSRGYLYVCNSDFAKMSRRDPTGFQSSLVVANLTSGAVLKYIDLSTVTGNLNIPRLANDVTFDENGHLYVTDSFGNQIWKIDGTTNVASVFVNDPRFLGDPFGADGIEYHNGYLITVLFSGLGSIFKIPVVNGVAGTVTVVAIEGILPRNLDGIVFFPNEDRFFGVNGDGRLFTLSSTNNFVTAVATHVANSTYRGPTSVTLKDGTPYVIANFYFDSLQPWYPIFSVNLQSSASQMSLSAVIPMICMIVVAMLL